MRSIHDDIITRAQTVAVMITVVITLLLPISAIAESSQKSIHIIHYVEEPERWIGLHNLFLCKQDYLPGSQGRKDRSLRKRRISWKTNSFIGGSTRDVRIGTALSIRLAAILALSQLTVVCGLLMVLVPRR